jgi:hypothetical protein
VAMAPATGAIEPGLGLSGRRLRGGRAGR